MARGAARQPKGWMKMPEDPAADIEWRTRSWLADTLWTAKTMRLGTMTEAERSVWNSMAEWAWDPWWGSARDSLARVAAAPSIATADAWGEVVPVYVLNSLLDQDAEEQLPDARRLGLVEEAQGYMRSVLAASAGGPPTQRQLLVGPHPEGDPGNPLRIATLGGWQIHYVGDPEQAAGGSTAWWSLEQVCTRTAFRQDPSRLFPYLDGPEALRQFALVALAGDMPDSQGGAGSIIPLLEGWHDDPGFHRAVVRHRLGERPVVLERLDGFGSWDEAAPMVDAAMALVAQGTPVEAALEAAGL